MAFYVFPPKGTVPLEKLCHITIVRMKFLMAVHNCRGNSAQMRDMVGDLEIAEDSDILIEDSDKDRISHFCLRMACLQDSHLREFFIEAEMMLFAYRLSCMQKEELMCAIKPLRKLLVTAEMANCKLSPSLVDVCHMIMYILHGRGWTRLIDSYYGNSENEFINIPFQYVDELVAKRCIELRGGIAAVPVSKLCDLLVFLFRQLLEFSIHKAKGVAEHQEKDRRLLGLFMVVKKVLGKSGLYGGQRELLGTITADQVDGLSGSFPPCMASLHERLRSSHRLPHHSRIRYTLFLKEAGLPLHEALQFWRGEYSKESVSSSYHSEECSHSWQLDAKRYTYNIRHLYGLEGSRKNYRGHSCEAIQENCSTTEAVGCPFKHYDAENLSRLLGTDILAEKKALIMKLANDRDFSRCCGVYRNLHLEKIMESSRERNICMKSLVKDKAVLQSCRTQMSHKQSDTDGNHTQNNTKGRITQMIQNAKVGIKIRDSIHSQSEAFNDDNEKNIARKANVVSAGCRTVMDDYDRQTSPDMYSGSSAEDSDCENMSYKSNESVDLFDSSFDETCSDMACSSGSDAENGSLCGSDCSMTHINYTEQCNMAMKSRDSHGNISDFSTVTENARELFGSPPKRIKLEYGSSTSTYCCEDNKLVCLQIKKEHIEGDQKTHSEHRKCLNNINCMSEPQNIENGKTERHYTCKDTCLTHLNNKTSPKPKLCISEKPPLLLEDEHLPNRIFKPVDYYVGYRKMLERLKLIQ